MRKKLFGGKILQKKGTDLSINFQEIYCDNGKVTLYNPLLNYKEINMEGKCILPAFFNMHSHLGESLFFNSISGKNWSLLKYLNYTESITNKMTKIQKEMFWEQSAIITAKKMKAEGTIGFCAARSTKIAEKFNLLNMSGYPIMNSPKLIKFKEEGIKGFYKFYNENNSTNSSVGIFFHSVYANDDNSFKLALESMKLGAEFITVHVSEDYDTYLLENKIHGMSAIELLNKYNLLNEKTILVHCGYCSEQDLDLISKKGALICVCPISNNFLNTKMPNLYLLEEKKIPWCISSDGLATGRTFSLLKQINEAKKQYPLIPIEKYINSITSIPGLYFKRNSYSGIIEKDTISTFLVVDYEGNDLNELFENLLNNKLKYQLISF